MSVCWSVWHNFLKVTLPCSHRGPCSSLEIVNIYCCFKFCYTFITRDNPLSFVRPSFIPVTSMVAKNKSLKVTTRIEKQTLEPGPSKMTYVYNGIRVKWSRIKWYTRCTLLYINFDGLYIIMNSPNRSLCTKFIIYAIILYGYQILRRSFFMAPVSRVRCLSPPSYQRCGSGQNLT